MKHLLLIFLLCSVTLLSCTTDAYEKGDGKYSLMEAELADVHIDGQGHADYFITDNDEHLIVSKTFSNNWMTKKDSIYRAVVYFSRTTNIRNRKDSAEIYSANRVGVIIPKQLKKDAEMKADPVNFESAWLSSSLRYLNASLYLMTGSTKDENALHILGCVADTLITNSDNTRTACVTLYHDQGGQPEYYSQRTFVSIPLDSIPADSIRLTVNTYKGPVIKKLKIKN